MQSITHALEQLEAGRTLLMKTSISSLVAVELLYDSTDYSITISMTSKMDAGRHGKAKGYDPSPGYSCSSATKPVPTTDFEVIRVREASSIPQQVSNLSTWTAIKLLIVCLAHMLGSLSLIRSRSASLTPTWAYMSRHCIRCRRSDGNCFAV